MLSLKDAPSHDAYPMGLRSATGISREADAVWAAAARPKGPAIKSPGALPIIRTQPQSPDPDAICLGTHEMDFGLDVSCNLTKLLEVSPVRSTIITVRTSLSQGW